MNAARSAAFRRITRPNLIDMRTIADRGFTLRLYGDPAFERQRATLDAI